MLAYLAPKTVPVVVFENEEAVERIGDLCNRFLPTIEIPLRNSFALSAIKQMKRMYPTVAVGAATIRTPRQADMALEAGADVIISPACPIEILEYCSKKKYPYMPGVATPTEVESSLSCGFEILKFFPATLQGGPTWIKTLNSVYKNFGVQWMPMGGITLHTLPEYFKIDNVIACGGSWMCPQDKVQQKAWSELEQLFLLNKKNLELIHE